MKDKINQKLLELPEYLEFVKKKVEDGCGLLSAEELIQKWLNTLGSLLTEKVVNDCPEPTFENTIKIKNKTFSYNKVSRRKIRDRFGGIYHYSRRVYTENTDGKTASNNKQFAPKDDLLGLTELGEFTPSMSYIISALGGNDSYDESAKTIKTLLQVDISGTGVQKTTERNGENFVCNPESIVPKEAQSEKCEAFVVSMDATGSPRISDKPKEGLGRDSLTNETITKMATVIQIEKFKQPISPRKSFKEEPPKPDEKYTWGSYADEGFDVIKKSIRKLALLAGRNTAKIKVFKGDGLPSNWKIWDDYFSDFIPILDPYHAFEHLSSFLRIVNKLRPTDELPKEYYKIKEDILEGDIYNVIAWMKEKVKNLAKTLQKEAYLEIDYFNNNKDRMHYDEYLKLGISVGTGNIESACKKVICKRFKKQGMRWRPKDNVKVLNIRLHLINGTLRSEFEKLIKKESYQPLVA